MIREIHLYGELQQIFDTDVIKIDCDNMIHVIGGLRQHYSEIEKVLQQNDWQIGVGKSKDNLVFLTEPEQLRMNLGDNQVHIAPVVNGEAFLAPVAAFIGTVFSGAAFGGGIIGAIVANLAVSLVVYGISMIFAPTPSNKQIQQKNDSQEENPSFLFNGAPNVSEAGYPVPIVCGRCRTGSAVIATAIDTESV